MRVHSVCLFIFPIKTDVGPGRGVHDHTLLRWAGAGVTGGVVWAASTFHSLWNWPVRFTPVHRVGLEERPWCMCSA